MTRIAAVTVRYICIRMYIYLLHNIKTTATIIIILKVVCAEEIRFGSPTSHSHPGRRHFIFVWAERRVTDSNYWIYLSLVGEKRRKIEYCYTHTDNKLILNCECILVITMMMMMIITSDFKTVWKFVTRFARNFTRFERNFLKIKQGNTRWFFFCVWIVFFFCFVYLTWERNNSWSKNDALWWDEKNSNTCHFLLERKKKYCAWFQLKIRKVYILFNKKCVKHVPSEAWLRRTNVCL